METPYEVMSADEHDRLVGLYGPLTDAVRELMDATIRTEADHDALIAARTAIQTATDALRSRQRDETKMVRYALGGRPVVWSNAVIGLRNPIAPPLTIHHGEDGTQCWSEFTLNGAYEGPPGLVHGGVCALILDHILGSAGGAAGRPGMTASLQLSYRRPTPLHRPLVARAWVEGEDGRKTTIRGEIARADGRVTVEASGLFVLPSFLAEKLEEAQRYRD